MSKTVYSRCFNLSNKNIYFQSTQNCYPCKYVYKYTECILKTIIMKIFCPASPTCQENILCRSFSVILIFKTNIYQVRLKLFLIPIINQNITLLITLLVAKIVEQGARLSINYCWKTMTFLNMDYLHLKKISVDNKKPV